MAQKVIRDPVHNHVFFDPNEPADKLALTLLDTPEMQRMRRIRQLGVSYLTYPGAEHSRFSHSLGVWHLAKQAIDFVLQNSNDEVSLTELQELAVNAAALLHDIGHGPLSHVLEHDFGGDHESRTRELIGDSSTGVHQVLRSHDPALPKLVERLLEGGDAELAWLRALVKSQLDADRMDYLLRDSYFCGVGYGGYDYQYVLHTMRVQPVPPDDVLQPVWLDKACRVIEEYLFARYYMHWNVYFHRTTKGYERLLSAICRRVASLLAAGGSVPIDTTLKKFVTKTKLTNSEHQHVDDHLLVAHVCEWQRNGDGVLADLCQRFCTRRGLKPIEHAEEQGASVFGLNAAIDLIREKLKAVDLDPDYYFLEAALSAKTYDYYHPEKETSERSAVNAILIQKPNGDVAEISSLPSMERLRAVTGKREGGRCFYVPDEQRTLVQGILETA